MLLLQASERNASTHWCSRRWFQSRWCCTTSACCWSTSAWFCLDPAGQERPTWLNAWPVTYSSVAGVTHRKLTTSRVSSVAARLSPSTCITSHKRWELLHEGVIWSTVGQHFSDITVWWSLFVLPSKQNWIPFFLFQELQLYLSDLANQIDRESGSELPLVVIIDDISDAGAVTELVNGALTCKYHKWCVTSSSSDVPLRQLSQDLVLQVHNFVLHYFFFSPYIVGTTNQPVKMTSNHGLHLSFRYNKVRGLDWLLFWS